MIELPAALLQSLEGLPGFDEQSFREVHESGAQVTSVRINPSKDFNVTDRFPGAENIPWCRHGYYLKERPSFTLDPLFHAGAYYVQEASSMFLEEALKQTVDLSQPLRILDLCGAPGGKSTLIQSLISANSLLVANELIKTRVGTLAENITKWGAANVIVTNNDAKDFKRLPSFFDVIVIDAPCSGSGLFRKDNDAISEWSAGNVSHCSLRQQRILADVLPSLKKDGVLIYSTCSYSEAEDEAVADTLVERHHLETVKLSAAQFPGIVETQSKRKHAFGYRFYPDRIKGEGFFIAAFRNEAGEEKAAKRVKSKIELLSKPKQSSLERYLNNAADLAFIIQDEDILAVPGELFNDLQEIRAALYIRKAGIRIGSLIRDTLVPAHDLALSGLASGFFPLIELDKETALDYLRKKDIAVPAEFTGWALAAYAEQPLGFLKILPGRINNYYPKELRILNR